MSGRRILYVVGAVVARRGKVVLATSVGWRDIEARKPMALDSIVRIYSMTKPITNLPKPKMPDRVVLRSARDSIRPGGLGAIRSPAKRGR